MTNDHASPIQFRSSLSALVAIGARCVVAALIVLHSAPVWAQASGEVLRPWNCLTYSVAAGSPIGTPVTPPGCTVPGVTWSAPGRASAINPPGIPSGLAAMVTGHTIVLTWTPPTTGGTPASYVLQAGSASGLANLASANTESDLPTLTATDVPNGTYFFRVLAVSASGASAPSNEISVRVGATLTTSAVGKAAACSVPPPPTSLTKAQNGYISVLFVWAAGEGDCQAFALPDSYSVDYGFAPGQTAGSLVVGSQPTNLTVSLDGVGWGTYYIRIRAHNANGYSLPSNEVVLNVGRVCGRAPLAPTGLVGSAAGSTIVLSWNDPTTGAETPASYRVSAGLTPGSTIAQLGSSISIFRINGVPAGSYYFRVEGVNACGVSGVSNEVFVTVGGPSVPVVVTGVHQFAGAPADGSNRSTLTLGRDGNFYGTSVTGGPVNSRCVSNLEGCGVIFRMTPAGGFTVLFAFGTSSPIYPYGTPLQASDGNFWGTTSGQENGGGAASLYRMTLGGAVTFVTELGGPSYASLVQGSDGSIYGTTVANGPGSCSWRSTQCTPSSGSGTVFKVNGDTVTYIHTFNGSDGSQPYGGLVQVGDGSLYGTTSAGGANAGTIYRITPGGSFTTVYTFTGGADGANPAYSNLILGSDGFIYGTTQFGGGSANAGVVFKMSLAGALTVLHGFTGTVTKAGDAPPTTAIDGLQPGAGLLEGPDGNLYGVAGGGGGLGGGTAFMVTKAGVYTQLYAFGGSSEGGSPTATFVLGPDGNLWSTAQYGGFSNRGVIFKMTIPR